MNNTGIFKEVKSWLEYHKGEEKIALEDLQQHGCISGMVSDMIYYTDTCRFYNKHRKEIISLVEDFCSMTGEGLKEFLQGANHFPLDKPELENETFVTGISGLIRKNSDVADQIKNWFSWFAFKEVARKYYEEKYENQSINS